ncbi:MAG TPA: hypothetical protein VK461_14615 [Acidimicrobiales bacterium]|nr:hypothetical protein [Acidimicrobiales bacterium]
MKAAATRLCSWAIARPLLSVFVVALVARVVVALGVFVFHHGALFADDVYFQRLARDMADGSTARWADYDRAIFYATSTFLWPLTLLAKLGSPVLPGQLLVAVVGAAAAVLTTAVALRGLRAAWPWSRGS